MLWDVLECITSETGLIWPKCGKRMAEPDEEEPQRSWESLQWLRLATSSQSLRETNIILAGRPTIYYYFYSNSNSADNF